MKKFFAIFIAFIIFSGCSSEKTTLKAKNEYFHKLEGVWTVSGVYYKNSLIDLDDVPELAGLYDDVMLTFADDGTFLYSNMYNRRGEYERYTSDKNDNEMFLLKTEYVFTYDLKGTSLVEKEWKNTEKVTYIITLLDDAIKLEEFDAITGISKSEDVPLIFSKNGENDYIKDNKVEISTNDSEETNQQGVSSSEPTPAPTAKPKPTPTPKPSYNIPTSGEKNALRKAKDYLAAIPMSYSGMIDQLEYEGFTYSEAKYGADNCGADWYEQAVLKAKDYLTLMGFSRKDLIEQLEFEGFTYEQASYAVDKVY